MKKIIDAVDKEVLKAELNPQCFVRDTNRGGNQVYIVDNQNAPNVIREIGRLREIAFRNGGGGTGEALDIDKFDTDPAYGYKQLVVWDPDAECIIGGYRYTLCDKAVFDYEGQPILTSSHLFRFSHRFLKKYFLKTIEFGRSFVSVDYQSSKAGSKSLYALDNLFDGIGALMLLYKNRAKYMFGKMTIYPSFPEEGLAMILYFLNKHFGERNEHLIVPKHPFKVKTPRRIKRVFTEDSFAEDYKILKAEILKMGVSIPPLVNSYMNLSATMKIFGTSINDEFGNVLDTGLLINFDEMNPDKKHRHVRMQPVDLKLLFRRFRKER
ncbi:MAG: GNAT family N-acetyltransferase [Bacteroidales bacterium]|nr:GNAT family N-acetyltransferase [Bacteroidales bacterium]